MKYLDLSEDRWSSKGEVSRHERWEQEEELPDPSLEMSGSVLRVMEFQATRSMTGGVSPLMFRTRTIC